MNEQAIIQSNRCNKIGVDVTFDQSKSSVKELKCTNQSAGQNQLTKSGAYAKPMGNQDACKKVLISWECKEPDPKDPTNNLENLIVS